jgi:hypothetical protein
VAGSFTGLEPVKKLADERGSAQEKHLFRRGTGCGTQSHPTIASPSIDLILE